MKIARGQLDHVPGRRWVGLLCVSLVAAWMLAWAPTRSAGANLDQSLQANTRNLIEKLREKKYHNVGVLKFLVKKGDDPETDNVGPLNLSIANRLEVALVLAAKDEDKMRVLQRASSQVIGSKNSRANHLTPEGRRSLFEIRPGLPYLYTPAWGDEKDKIPADAFLTGTVEIHSNLRDMVVKVQAFDKVGGNYSPLERFTANTDARILAEAGESYVLRRGIGDADIDTVVASAVNEVRQNKVHPVQSKEWPVQVELYYDGKRVPIKVDAHGQATVPEPQKGQKVHFMLRHDSSDKERYGVLLMINGENTLYRERRPPYLCHKWILEPGKSILVDGYQTGAESSEKFKVLSAEESRPLEINYGEHAGTFSYAIFREYRGKERPLPSGEERAIQRGEFLASTPGTLEVLQKKLLLKRKPGVRPDGDEKGLVVGGEKTKSVVEEVNFTSDTVPVAAATIRYYRPSSGK